MALRPATVADIHGMHTLRMSVKENALSDPNRIRIDDYFVLLDAYGRGWVYEIDGRIAGFGVADYDRRSIWALFVAPGFERRGIGRALHDAMINWLFEQGSEPLWLTTEPGTRADRFYRAAGWYDMGRTTSGEVRFELTRAAAEASLYAQSPCLPINRSMPVSVVVPVLGYPDVRAAVEWLCGAFGFVERLRIADHRSQLSLASEALSTPAAGATSHAPAPAGAEPPSAGSIVVAGLPPNAAHHSSGTDSAPTHSVMVRVRDVNAHHDRARRFGATILTAPTDFPYGERQYSVRDIGGYVWTFSQTLADVNPRDWGGTRIGLEPP